jgi:hypothetical protein
VSKSASQSQDRLWEEGRCSGKEEKKKKIKESGKNFPLSWGVP